MLKDLKVLNGNLELAFNEYNYIYTIEVEENVLKLEMDFKYEDGVVIEVVDNDLKYNDNIVYVKASKDNKEDVYVLYVHKNIVSETSGIDIYKESLEVKEEKVDLYKVQILSVSIFLLLVIIFCLLFKKKKLVKQFF